MSISDAVADQAADWLTLLMGGDASAEDIAHWQAWRAAHPDHERAWQHIETITRGLKVVQPGAGYQTLSSCGTSETPQRRGAIKLLLWGAALGGAGLWGTRTNLWQQQMADYRSDTGAQRTVLLSDGTSVLLNTGSAFNQRFDQQRRALQLIDGEIMVTTAHASGAGHATLDRRPLLVETVHGAIHALGTRFSVRLWPTGASVVVLDGAVEITPAAGAAARIVRRGEKTWLTATGVAATSAVHDADHAWALGQIIADNMRLADFLLELRRYRPGVIRCEPALAGLRLSGVFPLGDTDRILAALPKVLPVRVRQYSRYWVMVEAAPPA